jgi:hypothetical protein
MATVILPVLLRPVPDLMGMEIYVLVARAAKRRRKLAISTSASVIIGASGMHLASGDAITAKRGVS